MKTISDIQLQFLLWMKDQIIHEGYVIRQTQIFALDRVLSKRSYNTNSIITNRLNELLTEFWSEFKEFKKQR